MATLVPNDEAFPVLGGGDASSIFVNKSPQVSIFDSEPEPEVKPRKKRREKKQNKPKSLLSKIVDVVLLLVILVSFSGAAYFYFQNAGEEAAYNELAELAHTHNLTESEAAANGQGGGGGAGADAAAAAADGQDQGDNAINWDELKAINSHTAAWITIQNTPINYAVVQAWEEEPDYWLHHDFWNEYGWWGVPFIDYRTHANGQHVLTYAHHLGDTDMMYTPIYQCYEQWKMDEIGNLIWQTPEWGTSTFEPAFSMIVNQYDMTPQTFEWKPEGLPDGEEEGAHFAKDDLKRLVEACDETQFDLLTDSDRRDVQRALNEANLILSSTSATQAEYDAGYKHLYVQIENLNFHIWLHGWAMQASAVRSDLENKLKQAKRVITCVTCARSYTGLPDRTVVVFVSNETKE